MSLFLLFTGKVILNIKLISIVCGCQNFYSASARQLLTRYIPAGTRIQALAWKLASPHITDYITLAVTTPDNQRHWIEPIFRGRLSLADTIVLVHRLGLVNAAEIVTVVDPWQYPEDATTVAPGIRNYIQRAVDKAAHAGKNILDWTDESKTGYLVSPLLSRNRPCLVRISKAKSGSTSVMPVLPASPPTALAMPGLTPAPTEPAIVQLLAPVLAEGTPPPCLIHEPTTSRCF